MLYSIYSHSGLIFLLLNSANILIEGNQNCDALQPDGRFHGIFVTYLNTSSGEKSLSFIYKSGKMAQLLIEDREGKDLFMTLNASNKSHEYEPTDILILSFKSSTFHCHLTRTNALKCKQGSAIVFTNHGLYAKNKNIIAFNPTTNHNYQDFVFLGQNFNRDNNSYERKYFDFNYRSKTLSRNYTGISFINQLDNKLLLTGVIPYRNKGHIVFFYVKQKHKYCLVETNITSENCKPENLRQFLSFCEFENPATDPIDWFDITIPTDDTNNSSEYSSQLSSEQSSEQSSEHSSEQPSGSVVWLIILILIIVIVIILVVIMVLFLRSRVNTKTMSEDSKAKEFGVLNSNVNLHMKISDLSEVNLTESIDK